MLTDLGTGANNDGNGWYVGGGFDFLLSDDVWGLWNQASILAELSLEYKILVRDPSLQHSPCSQNPLQKLEILNSLC